MFTLSLVSRYIFYFISSVTCLLFRSVLFSFHVAFPFLTFFLVLCAGSESQLNPTPCEPMDCSPLDFSVHGISQARIQEQDAIYYSRGSSRPRDQTCISCVSKLAGRLFTTDPTWEPLFSCSWYLILMVLWSEEMLEMSYWCFPLKLLLALPYVFRWTYVGYIYIQILLGLIPGLLCSVLPCLL